MSSTAMPTASPSPCWTLAGKQVPFTIDYPAATTREMFLSHGNAGSVIGHA